MAASRKSATPRHPLEIGRPSPGKDDNLQTFKTQLNVVDLFFNVKDKHGMLIPNLTKN